MDRGGYLKVLVDTDNSSSSASTRRRTSLEPGNGYGCADEGIDAGMMEYIPNTSPQERRGVLSWLQNVQRLPGAVNLGGSTNF